MFSFSKLIGLIEQRDGFYQENKAAPYIRVHGALFTIGISKHVEN
jgi:hypothetical protein